MSEPIKEILDLLDIMAMKSGTLVCSSDCTPEEIANARAESRFFVLENCIGYVFRPKVSAEESLRIIADAPITKRFNEMKAENDAMRVALENIANHQRIVGGKLASLSPTYLIAKAALEALDDG